MKSLHLQKSFCLFVAGVVLMPPSIFASDVETAKITDVLLADGVLTGIVVSDDATPAAEESVQILFGSKVVATTNTTPSGEFAVRGLRQGQHSLVVNGEVRPVRFWEATTAPPSAVSTVSVVKSNEMVVRAQGGGANMAGGMLILGAFAGVVGTTLYYTIEENGSETPAPASP